MSVLGRVMEDLTIRDADGGVTDFSLWRAKPNPTIDMDAGREVRYWTPTQARELAAWLLAAADELEGK